MKTIGLLLAGLVAVIGQASAPAQAAGPVRTLVYQFGYNTKVAKQGTGTGSTTIEILGPAKDGGLRISGSDHWWNTVRPRAKNTCEVYPTGTVKCAEAPYAISPIQLTLFPLLAAAYFHSLTSSGTSSWTQTYSLYAAIIPGAAGPAGTPVTWNCVYKLEGKGPIANSAPLILVTSNGTLDQQGGHYRQATSKQRIAYDPVAKIPVIVSDVRTHLPQRSVYNNDLIEVQLTKDSGASH